LRLIYTPLHLKRLHLKKRSHDVLDMNYFLFCLY
jgi:hypothetical protein